MVEEEFPYVTPETIVQRKKLLWVFWDEPFESVMKRLAPRQYEELSESEKVRLMGKIMWDLFQRFDVPAEVRDRIDFLARADPKLSLRENLESIAEHSKDPLVRETVKKIISQMEYLGKRAMREAEKGWEIIYEAEQPKPGEVIVEYFLQHPEELEELRRKIKTDPEEAMHMVWELVKPEIGASEASEEDVLRLLVQKELEGILEAIETIDLQERHIENIKERLNRCISQLQKRIEEIKKKEAIPETKKVAKPQKKQIDLTKVFRATKPEVLTLREIAMREKRDIHDVLNDIILKYTRKPREIRCIYLMLLDKGLDKVTEEDIKKAYQLCKIE